ncbi:unconventional prefoldin RPB5 interactor 1-like [Anneissia japonica]|uniref:unconventional prefoldin RPB5 interactor 1-like n=1 Tax=Anneissia japonica TaxID=1529436 RepID=UPI0014255A45|nr:unconventional prefoldin RPB5 interactor 1-like [Anneissia japonica]
MDTSKITRLEEEQIKAFQDTLSKLQQWETFKKDYEILEDRLKTLPDKVTHQVMVPFGPMAFMPGQLVHTNEINVLLGDDWFVERSAKQACGIVQRRINHVQGMIKDLQKQKELLEARLGFTADFKAESSQGEGVVDIREEYDAEKEAKWRDERQKKRKAATMSQATPRNINVDHKPSTAKNETPVEAKPSGSVKKEQKKGDGEEKTAKQKRMEEMEAALFARLDALEKQEEEFDELAMLSDFDENEDYDEDDDDSDDEDDTPVGDTKKKRVQWKDSSQGEERQDLTKITFQHSKLTTTEAHQSSETDAEKPGQGVIQSPRDLYNLVQTSKDGEKSSSAVRSILKKQSSYGELVFTGSVVERIPVPSTESSKVLPKSSLLEPSNQPPATKRVSKFKAARQAKR